MKYKIGRRLRSVIKQTEDEHLLLQKRWEVQSSLKITTPLDSSSKLNSIVAQSTFCRPDKHQTINREMYEI